MKKNDFETHFLECDCFAPEHIVRIVFDEELKTIYVEPLLNHYQNFLKRLWEGIKYIFKIKSNQAHFDTVVLNIDSSIKLRDKLDDFIDKCLIEEFNSKSEENNGKN